MLKTMKSQNDNNQDILLTVKELASMLKTSNKAIYTMAERRLLPGIVKLRKRLLFKKEAIIQWINDCEQEQIGDDYVSNN